MMLIKCADLTLFRFPRPKLHFGQLVKTVYDGTGYIVGMHFYPEAESWLYSLFMIERQGIEEFWYEAKELQPIEVGAQSIEMR